MDKKFNPRCDLSNSTDDVLGHVDRYVDNSKDGIWIFSHNGLYPTASVFLNEKAIERLQEWLETRVKGGDA